MCYKTEDDYLISQMENIFLNNEMSTQIEEVYNFNRRFRESWVIAKAKTVPAGSQVLDVGAGTCPYRPFFLHCDYKTHDFKKYDGVKRNKLTEYGQIDFECDITNIPVQDNSFDLVLCTDVLEHVPEPIEAIREMSRMLRPGGRIFLTAPLCSGLHQLPYHYYGGYTPQWYKHFFPKFGLQIKEFVPNGGLFALLSQECIRVASILAKNKKLHGNNIKFILLLFGKWLPYYLLELDEKCFIDQFTDGYLVEAEKYG